MVNGQQNLFIMIIMGVTGSGKTTIGKLLAKDLGWPFYDGDDFHPEANIKKMRAGIPLDDNDREAWLASLRGLIQHKIAEHEPAIVACSALKQKYRDRLQQDHENEIAFVYLKGDYELLQQRLQTRRGHFMNPNLLASQFDALEEPEGMLTIEVATAPERIVETVKRELKLEGGDHAAKFHFKPTRKTSLTKRNSHGKNLQDSIPREFHFRELENLFCL